MKAQKNKIEIQGAKNANLRDGVTITKFLFWLKNKMIISKTNEIKAANYLYELRKKNELFHSLSFETISAINEHAAIPHYRVDKKSNKNFKKNCIYLFDSGGQYFDGTTDITRTVIKGKPSDILKDMFQVVLQGQKIGVQLVKAGRNSKTIHNSIKDFFDDSGFQTDFSKNNPDGFIHSTGHGLGLDIHEPPRVSSLSEVLKSNNVITIEPGLYYPKIGGIRIEDTVVVTEKGCRNLTSFPKIFEI